VKSIVLSIGPIARAIFDEPASAARHPPPPYCKIKNDGRESRRRGFQSGSP
jgi:hypothetical protein